MNRFSFKTALPFCASLAVFLFAGCFSGSHEDVDLVQQAAADDSNQSGHMPPNADSEGASSFYVYLPAVVQAADPSGSVCARGRRSAIDLLNTLADRREGDVVWYRFTPNCGSSWCTEYRAHGHESMAALAAAAVGDFGKAKGILRSHLRNLKSKDGYLIFPYIVKPDGGKDDSSGGTFPLIGWMAHEVYKLDGSRDKGFLEEAYNSALQHHTWLWNTRGVNNRGFRWKNHFESVRDTFKDGNGAECLVPSFKSSGCGADLAAVDLTSYMAAEVQALRNAAQVLGKTGDAESLQRKYDSLKAMLQAMWDPNDKFFYPKKSDGTVLRFKEIAGFLPLLAGAVTPEQASALASQLDTQAGAFPPASLAAGQPGYRAAGAHPQGQHWLGGMWTEFGLLIVKGLADSGRSDAARRLAKKIVDVVYDQRAARGSFFEFYNSETGSGEGYADYIFATTVLAVQHYGQYSCN